jgi:hypothetical protein
MAIGYLSLPPAAWYPTDDSSGSASAQLSKRVTSDATDPQANWMEWLFDATTQEHIMCQFVMPGNYSGSPVLKVYYKMTSATANYIQWGAALMALTDADAQDADSDEFASANVAYATVPGTAGYLDVISITLSNADSVAAGDHVVLVLYRDADDGTYDTATGDAEFVNAEFQFAA